MVVVDASAVAAALLRDGPARAILATEQLHAPHLVDSEVTSMLRRTVRTGSIAEPAGRAALGTLSRLGLTRYPAVGLYDRVWDLRDNLTAYDAAYVALAETLGCALVTADARISRAPGLGCPVTVVPG